MSIKTKQTEKNFKVRVSVVLESAYCFYCSSNNRDISNFTNSNTFRKKLFEVLFLMHTKLLISFYIPWKNQKTSGNSLNYEMGMGNGKTSGNGNCVT